MLEMLHPHLACDELSVAITLALPPKQPRLRVLCCHGYAGGARRFETKTAKALLAHPSIADLLDVADSVTAPYLRRALSAERGQDRSGGAPPARSGTDDVTNPVSSA